MRFFNAKLYLSGHGFAEGGFTVENGKFQSVFTQHDDASGIDLRGALVLPGLIDTHIHGCVGADFSDGSEAGLHSIAAYLASHGVTSFLPTSMTLPFSDLKRAFLSAKRMHETAPRGCAKVLGIHMEGPFLAERKKGAQNADYLMDPDFDAFCALQSACGGLIRVVDVAAELPRAVEFASKASVSCHVSAAHTAANYDQAIAFFDAGADRVTHLFNAMNPLLHREPGLIGAACERDPVFAELICDGIHVHPAVIRAAFRLFPNRICLISDALRCCGMPNGVYDLSGQAVFLEHGAARLKDGTIAGAATNLFDNLRKVISLGVNPSAAIDAATIIPAKSIGLEDEIGSIEVNKAADFVICSDEYEIKQVYINGFPVKEG